MSFAPYKTMTWLIVRTSLAHDVSRSALVTWFGDSVNYGPNRHPQPLPIITYVTRVAQLSSSSIWLTTGSLPIRSFEFDIALEISSPKIPAVCSQHDI